MALNASERTRVSETQHDEKNNKRDSLKRRVNTNLHTRLPTLVPLKWTANSGFSINPSNAFFKAFLTWFFGRIRICRSIPIKHVQLCHTTKICTTFHM